MANDNKLTILFLAANPADTDRLKLDEEMHAIDDVLQKAEYRDRFDLRSAWAVRYGDLQELLLRFKPHIVHFSGHGSATGEIALTDERGRTQLVTSTALAQLFSILKDNVRCVLLNACYTEVQARGIAASIDCVVGMSRAILDDAAINFAAGFYLGLGYGRSVQTAFDLGCNRIGLAGEGTVRRNLLLLSTKTDQGDAAAKLHEGDIPQLIALRVNPATMVLVGVPVVDNKTSGGADPRVVQPGKLTKLTGQQYKQFQAALLNAFTTVDTLREMVQFELGENLNRIAGGSDLSAIIFNLIDWAQRTGNLDRLLDGALASNPQNSDLQALAALLRPASGQVGTPV
jgi:hypothetical protein